MSEKLQCRQLQIPDPPQKPSRNCLNQVCQDWKTEKVLHQMNTESRKKQVKNGIKSCFILVALAPPSPQLSGNLLDESLHSQCGTLSSASRESSADLTHNLLYLSVQTCLGVI